MSRLRKAVLVTMTAALALTAPSAVSTATAQQAHSPRLVLTSGQTSLAVAPATAQALSSNGIKVTPASEARVTRYGISFPIIGGIVDPATLYAIVAHSGGLTFSAKGKSLTLRTFFVNTSTKHLSAYVDQLRTRVRVLDLNLSKVKVFSSSRVIRVLGVVATLNAGAAAALNKYFGVSLFKGGLPIGTARIDARYQKFYV